ncbi:hypothetical protein CANCADRAFT_11758, partial [Tortispora caseinolytica NRRL Y-17796]
IMSTKRELSKEPFRVIVGSYEHHLACFAVDSTFIPIFYFAPHTSAIRCMAQSKRYLVSGSNDEHIRLYDLQKRKELGSLIYHDGSITALAFYGTKWLMSASDEGLILLWRTKDWEVMAQLKGHKGRVNDIAIHPSGKVAVSVGIDRSIRLWNLMTAKKAAMLKLGKDEPLKVDFNSQGTTIAIGFNRSVQIFDPTTMTSTKELKFTSPLQHIAHVSYPDSHAFSDLLLIAFSNGDIIAYDPVSLDQVYKISTGANRVKHFSVSTIDDAMWLAAVSSDGLILVYDISSAREPSLFAKHQVSERLTCCVLVPDNVEKAETMKKRKIEGAESDMSATEPEDESEE